ncbi:MAG: hypothetical protein ACREKE_05915 [bacterium]
MNSALKFQKFLAIFTLVALVSVGLRANTPTSSPTASPSPTPIYTATPGSGSYAYTLVNNVLQPETTPFVVPGQGGYTLYITYTAAVQFQSGGIVGFQIPSDFVTPGVVPTYQAYQVPEGEEYEVQSMTPFNQGVSLTVNGLNPGDSLILEYCVINPGFSMVSASAQTNESVLVSANPLSQAQVEGGGLVPAPSPILVYTATDTPTVTPTFTISPTFTVSDTSTPTPNWTATPTSSYTVSPTDTPVGPVPSAAQGFYTYPNPFDLRSYPFVTVRFPPITNGENATITIFSLMGNPVCSVPASDIQAAQGLAQWNGRDDYGRTVPGGLYFVRFKTPSRTIVHKMTVLH